MTTCICYSLFFGIPQIYVNKVLRSFFMEQRLIEILKIALEYQVSDIHFDITNGKKADTERR